MSYGRLLRADPVDLESYPNYTHTHTHTHTGKETDADTPIVDDSHQAACQRQHLVK